MKEEAKKLSEQYPVSYVTIESLWGSSFLDGKSGDEKISLIREAIHLSQITLIDCQYILSKLSKIKTVGDIWELKKLLGLPTKSNQERFQEIVSVFNTIKSQL